MTAFREGETPLEEQERALLQQALRTYEGRAAVWMALRFSKFDELSFRSEETHDTAFNEGGRYVGLQLRDEVFTVAPETYNMMYMEAIERQHQFADTFDPDQGDL